MGWRSLDSPESQVFVLPNSGFRISYRVACFKDGGLQDSLRFGKSTTFDIPLSKIIGHSWEVFVIITKVAEAVHFENPNPKLAQYQGGAMATGRGIVSPEDTGTQDYIFGRGIRHLGPPWRTGLV